jgi:serine/threonine-protein kinase
MKIDKYEVIEEIGRGGMGAVYKAVHPQFEKYVAIKEVRSDLAGNRDIQRKFEQEARLLAQLPPHPNIVTVRDALVADRRLYLVLDYIEGTSLAELLQSGGIDPVMEYPSTKSCPGLRPFTIGDRSPRSLPSNPDRPRGAAYISDLARWLC